MRKPKKSCLFSVFLSPLEKFSPLETVSKYGRRSPRVWFRGKPQTRGAHFASPQNSVLLKQVKQDDSHGSFAAIQWD